ncbi:dihydrolipoyl dehydrogenase [Flaviaesturariibacter amylovorans]|uniref:Dihydrolipoyl dehydrogenase n=1 Tax=Flaviaesturariibacter amylovorans TaxID=1084520 RepID=A0ABP8HLX8_9BACT
MNYDVIIIGSGPGGYVCAIRCGQLGLKTALIEKYDALGGTCLNVGCIPSKAMLESSEHYHNAKEKFSAHGIHLDNLQISLSEMIAHKADVVKKTGDGVKYLMRKNKVDVYYGVGSFLSANKVRVTANDGKETDLETIRVVIATGSKPSSLPGVTIDKKRIISSTEALALQEIPKHLIVIGGGVIGMELGSVYARIGAKVTVVEYMDQILSTMDKALGKELQKPLSKLGFTFHFNHKVTGATNHGDKVVVTAENKAGETVSFEGDYCLMAIGRKPYTAGLNIESIGIATEKGGRIAVDENFRTSVENIYAIGDVVRGPMLAHKASEEGVYVAEQFARKHPHINYRSIPNIVYTWPEVASVGHTEEELIANGIEYKSGSFPILANARARMNMDTDGFIKVLVHGQTDEILGIHMIGPRAADIVGEAALAVNDRCTADGLSKVVHGHPTFYESLKEACLAATGKGAIHF